MTPLDLVTLFWQTKCVTKSGLHCIVSTQAHWLIRSNSDLATLNPPLRRTKITTFRIFYRHFLEFLLQLFFFITTWMLLNLTLIKGFIIYINQFLIISWNKLLDNIISRNYVLILLRIMHEFNQDWLNLYQTEIGSFHPLCLTHTHTHTRRARRGAAAA